MFSSPFLGRSSNVIQFWLSFNSGWFNHRLSRWSTLASMPLVSWLQVLTNGADYADTVGIPQRTCQEQMDGFLKYLLFRGWNAPLGMYQLSYRANCLSTGSQPSTVSVVDGWSGHVCFSAIDEKNSWPNSKSIQLQSPESNDQIKTLSEESSSLAQIWMTVSLYNFACVSTIHSVSSLKLEGILWPNWNRVEPGFDKTKILDHTHCLHRRVRRNWRSWLKVAQNLLHWHKNIAKEPRTDALCVCLTGRFVCECPFYCTGKVWPKGSLLMRRMKHL